MGVCVCVEAMEGCWGGNSWPIYNYKEVMWGEGREKDCWGGERVREIAGEGRESERDYWGRGE